MAVSTGEPLSARDQRGPPSHYSSVSKTVVSTCPLFPSPPHLASTPPTHQQRRSLHLTHHFSPDAQTPPWRKTITGRPAPLPSVPLFESTGQYTSSSVRGPGMPGLYWTSRRRATPNGAEEGRTALPGWNAGSDLGHRKAEDIVVLSGQVADAAKAQSGGPRSAAERRVPGRCHCLPVCCYRRWPCRCVCPCKPS